MKLRSRFLIVATLGLAGSGSHTWCMNSNLIQPDSSSEKVSITNLPVELVRCILSKLPMERYLDVSKVMKLRQVCKQWSELLTNDFITSSMSKVLLSSKDHHRAIVGNGLAAKLQEFCHVKLLDKEVSKKNAQLCLENMFDMLSLPRFSNLDMSLCNFLYKICFTIHNYQIRPDDIFDPKDFDLKNDTETSPVAMILTHVAFEEKYTSINKSVRYAIFNLLLDHFGVVSNRTILDAIAKKHDSLILGQVVLPKFNPKLDAFYLFASLVKQSSEFLMSNYANRPCGFGIAPTELEQLIRLCLERGNTSEQLLNIVRNQQNENIEQHCRSNPNVRPLFELEKNNMSIEEACEANPDFKIFFQTMGRDKVLVFKDSFYALEKLVLNYCIAISATQPVLIYNT